MRMRLVWLSCFMLSCNGGLEPPATVPGIDGVITYEPSSWPPVDSLEGLWLFASTEYPLDSASVISGVLIDRTILVYPSLTEILPLFVPETAFSFDLPSGTYRYVGVIQQHSPGLFVQNFRVVGVLKSDAGDGSPRTVIVSEGRRLEGLAIPVDFGEPPPQPFF